MPHSRRKAAIRDYAQAHGLTYQQAWAHSRHGPPPAAASGEPASVGSVDAGSRRTGTPVPLEFAHLRPEDLNAGGKIIFDSPDASFLDPVFLPGQVIGGTLTDDEGAMINLMHPQDRNRYLLQKRIQEKAEMGVLLSELQSLRHQTAMSVINNIR
jgi:hypothetical protein